MSNVGNLESDKAQAAILAIRLLVGAVFFLEGIKKFLFPEQWGAGRFAGIGIPAPHVMGPFVGAVETICGLLVMLGIRHQSCGGAAADRDLHGDCHHENSHPVEVRVLAHGGCRAHRLLHAHGADFSFVRRLRQPIFGRAAREAENTIACSEPRPIRAQDALVQASRNERFPRENWLSFFLRLGTTAFGGPAAHIAIMEDELVRRRKWLSREKFLDLLGASSLIPGPSSSELAIHIGYLRAGWAGLVVGGVCFILPAAILVAIIAWAYVRFGHLPAVAGVLYGVKPVVDCRDSAGVVGTRAHGGQEPGLLRLRARFALCSASSGVNAFAILFGAGAILACFHAISAEIARTAKRRGTARLVLLWGKSRANLARFFPLAGRGRGSRCVPGLWPLFLVFLRIGSMVFGSGYVLLAFLRADLVVHRGVGHATRNWWTRWRSDR